MSLQLSLFDLPPTPREILPQGFAYQPDLIGAEEEDDLVRRFAVHQSERDHARQMAAFDQNSQTLRSLNQLMWQVPLIAMSLTGGLWFARIYAQRRFMPSPIGVWHSPSADRRGTPVEPTLDRDRQAACPVVPAVRHSQTSP